MSKEPKLERGQWFSKENKFIATNICRRICRRQLPEYLIDIYNKGWLSDIMIHLACSRYWRALFLLPIVLIIGYTSLLVNSNGETLAGWHALVGIILATIVFVDAFLVAGIILALPNIREFSLCIKHIIELADSSTRHKLAPENFPKTKEKFVIFVDDTLLEMARWVIWYQAHGELDKEAEIRVKLRRFYDTAESFGLSLKDYKYYYDKAEVLHKSGFPASKSGSFLTKK